MKKEVRVLGIDDAPFDKFKDPYTEIIGVMYRGGSFLDGVVSTKIRVDGKNATMKIIDMINRSKFKPQLQYIMFGGIAVGGFNVLDIAEIHKKTKIPVMVVIRRNPNIKRIHDVLIHLKKEDRFPVIQRAGPVIPLGDLYVQYKGMTHEEARKLLKITCTHAKFPEPLRVAHIIASGIKRGESKGQA